MKYLISCSVIWALSFGLIKYNLTSLDSTFVAFARMAFALPVFLPFLKIKGLSLSNIARLIGIGAVQFGLMYILCIKSYQYLEAYQVVLFATLTPLYVTLINDLFMKKFNPYYLFLSCLAVLGAGLLYFQPNAETKNLLIGFLLVQTADVCFAFGQVSYRRFRLVHTDLKDQNIFGFLFMGATLVTGVFSMFFDGWQRLGEISYSQLLILVYLGSIASGLCFFWWNRAAIGINAGTLAVLNNLKIPAGVLASLIVFGEQVDVFKLTVSFILIALALFLSERKKLNIAWKLSI